MNSENDTDIELDDEFKTDADCVEAIVQLASGLDVTWIQEECLPAWGRFSSKRLHYVVRAYAAQGTHYMQAASEAHKAARSVVRTSYFSSAYSANTAAAEVAFAYFVYVSGGAGDYDVACERCSNQLDGDCCFDQAAVDVMVGYVMGCIGRGACVQSGVKEALEFVGSSEVLREVLGVFRHLKRACDAWDPNAIEDLERACDTREEHKQCQRLWMVLCGAVACGVGMALPMYFGAVIPWACVLAGACVGGLLSCKEALPQSSIDRAARMIMGWAMVGLVAGCVSWGVLSLVAGHGMALAIGVGAAALCTGGLGHLWSRAVAGAETGNSSSRVRGPVNARVV